MPAGGHLAEAPRTTAEAEGRALQAFEEHGEKGQVAEAQAREEPRRGQREPEQAPACQVKVWLGS